LSKSQGGITEPPPQYTRLGFDLAFAGISLQWARDMKTRCQAAGVAFFFKQSSHRFTERGTTLDGETVRHYPTPRRIALPIAGQQPSLF
jgi:hypothetical protein